MVVDVGLDFHWELVQLNVFNHCMMTLGHCESSSSLVDVNLVKCILILFCTCVTRQQELGRQDLVCPKSTLSVLTCIGFHPLPALCQPNSISPKHRRKHVTEAK